MANKIRKQKTFYGITPQRDALEYLQALYKIAEIRKAQIQYFESKDPLVDDKCRLNVEFELD